MKERSLVERIVAILGVLLGTVAWVVRLLFSMVKGLLSGGSQPDDGRTDTDRAGVGGTAKTYATGLRQKSETLLGDVKEKGGSLIEDVRERGEDLVEEAREKVDEVMHRGETASSEQDGDSHFTAEGSATERRIDISATQHDDIGGVPPTPESGAVAAASLSAMDSVYDERSSASMDEDSETEMGTHVTEGIPNLEEPGESDESSMYGSESGSLMSRDDDSGYAGQAMSESDIGIDRGDSLSGFADSGDRSGGEFRGWVSDEVNLDQEEAPGEEDDTEMVDDQDGVAEAGQQAEYDAAWVEDQINAEDEPVEDDDEDDVPAASRGWQAPEDDVLKDDPLYGDFESSGAGGEVDIRNDEADEEDAAGMHIVDSPDEPFIEDEDASQSLGFVNTGTEPPFDTSIEDIDVDEIGEERISLGENDLAADALGHPAGGDAASGDLGPEESPDDAIWEPGASRPDYDVTGAYDGSGVDEFESDSVAESMLDDVSAGEETAPDTLTDDDDATSGGETTSGTGSIAWATSSGVVDRDLAKPLSAEELQSSEVTSGTAGTGEPGVTEADADLKDVAADVADGVSGELGDQQTATGTTMSGAGQSAGAMTSDDAATGEEGSGEMTTDSGSVETGGLPAENADAGEGATAGEAGGSSGPRSFDDVLPDSEYASSVGYETLQADDAPRGGRDDFSESSFLTETSTSGQAPATTGTQSSSGRTSKRPAPEGSIRGDGSGSCPADFPIKGNANSKIYHRPTDSSYESTIPEFCFATEEDAKAAGFRPRKS